MISEIEASRRVDICLIRADATFADYEQLCRQATKLQVQQVVVAPASVGLCAYRLVDSPVQVTAAVAFPLGQLSIRGKASETAQAIDMGANAVHFVINVTEMKAGNIGYLATEMQQVVDVCRDRGVGVTAIVEACYLTDAQLRELSDTATAISPDALCTSTGWGSHGATASDVALLRHHTGHHIGVVAAGGVRSPEQAVALLNSGADKIVTSTGAALIAALNGRDTDAP